MKLSDFDKYEIKAIAFHAMTRQMAPGKDRPSVGPTVDDVSGDALMVLWDKWNADNRDCINAMLRAFAQHFDDE